MGQACNAEDSIKPFNLVMKALKESTDPVTNGGGSRLTEVADFVETYLCPPMENDICLKQYVKEALKRTIALGYAKYDKGKYQFRFQADKKPPPPCEYPCPPQLCPRECKVPCPPCCNPCPPYCPPPKPKPCPPPPCPKPCPSCPKKCPGFSLGLQGGPDFKTHPKSSKPTKYLAYGQSFDSFRKARNA